MIGEHGPTASGENWDVYLGAQRFISQQEAAAVAAEAEYLWNLPDPIAGDCRVTVVPNDRFDAGVKHVTQHWAVAGTTEFHADYLKQSDGRHQRVIERIPRLFALIERAEAFTGSQKRDFVLNRFEPYGIMAEHQDAFATTVVAINLSGSGRVRLTDAGTARRYRFHTEPGDAMVLRNGEYDDDRPYHRAAALGAGRLSIAL